MMGKKPRATKQSLRGTGVPVICMPTHPCRPGTGGRRWHRVATVADPAVGAPPCADVLGSTCCAASTLQIHRWEGAPNEQWVGGAARGENTLSFQAQVQAPSGVNCQGLVAASCRGMPQHAHVVAMCAATRGMTSMCWNRCTKSKSDCVDGPPAVRIGGLQRRRAWAGSCRSLRERRQAHSPQ